MAGTAAGAGGAGFAGVGGGGLARDVELRAAEVEGGERGAGRVEVDAGEVLGAVWSHGRELTGQGGRLGDGGVGGVAGGVADTEGGGGEDGVGGIGPKVSIVEDGARGVEDAAVGGFVDELQGRVFALANLVADVERQVRNPDVFFSRG